MTYARRVDRGSPQLVKVARQLGFTVLLVNGEIDAILVRSGRVHLVDWKAGPKAKKTARQLELVEQGVPVQFIHSTEQLLALVQR